MYLHMICNLSQQRNGPKIMLPESHILTRNRTGVSFVGESSRGIISRLWHLSFLFRSKQKMTFFVVTIFNLGHFTCVGPMYDSDYELAILLIQLILVFKMEMTNKNI